MSYWKICRARFPQAEITGIGRWCVYGKITGNCWCFQSKAGAEKRLNERCELIDLTPTLESQMDMIPDHYDREEARRERQGK